MGRLRAFRATLMSITVMAGAIAGLPASAQSLAPLTGFGTNGWAAPGSATYLGTGNFERGLAYNPVTDNLILVSRTGGDAVRALSSTTGSQVSQLGLGTGVIAGGAFVINMVDVAADGAIYVGNMTTSAATSPFKVYRWANESATPTVAFSGTFANPTRIGDSFAVRGAGDTTQFVSAGSTTTANGNFIQARLISGTFAATAYTGIANTLTATNDYRLSLTYVNDNTIIGNQGASTAPNSQARWTTFDGTTATVQNSLFLDGANVRILDYTEINGKPFLAAMNTTTNGVSVWDVSNPSSPIRVAVGNTTTSTNSNGNQTGSIAWGKVTGDTATLYAMNTNNGIQAFTFTAVPEPSTWAMAGLAGAALAGQGLWRARAKRRRRAVRQDAVADRVTGG